MATRAMDRRPGQAGAVHASTFWRSWKKTMLMVVDAVVAVVNVAWRSERRPGEAWWQLWGKNEEIRKKETAHQAGLKGD